MEISTWIQLITSSILLGGVYAMVAVGLTLIFGVIKIVNFAHGQFLMLGMFSSFFLWSIFGIDPFLSVIFVLPIFFVVGIFVQRLLIQPILNAPDYAQIFLTLGLSIVIENLALLAWSADFRTARTSYSMYSIDILGIAVSYPRLIACIASLVSVAALTLLLKRTNIGRAIRATSMDRYAAQLMGINVNKIYWYSFGIGIAMTACAGCFLITFYFTQALMGSMFGVISFIIVVLGGLGSIPGALIGSFIIGVSEGIGGTLIASEAKSLVAFAIFIMILMARPQGLFGERIS
ncbi:MAG: branched-chain amino acid ABC transporter permease [Candidatus Bathyarchaeia archaeon]